jgi:hypothetical protein
VCPPLLHLLAPLPSVANPEKPEPPGRPGMGAIYFLKFELNF